MKRKRFDKDGNTTSLGKVVVVGTPNANNINSIANNGTTNDSIANELNAIYNPTGIQINVTVDDQISIPQSIWDIENTNGQLDIGNSNILANYTPEERAIYNYYKTQRTLQDQMYYIFVLGDDISTTDTNAAGFMPLKRQYGFVFNPPNKSRTIAHELGHGIFGLEHPFTEYAIREGTTDLLMDYGTGTAFTHLDWQKIHAPGLKFYIFQGDEDGEERSDYSSTRRMVEAIRKANLDRNDTLDITEYGSKGGISREFEVLYDGDTLKLKVASPLLATDIKNIINPSKKPNPKPVSGKEGWVTYEFKNLQGRGRFHNTKISVKDAQIELFESYLWDDILTEDKKLYGESRGGTRPTRNPGTVRAGDNQLEREIENQLNKPCPGNPIKNPTIAPTSAGRKEGGLYGWTRRYESGKKKFHAGIDIKSSPNSTLYAMHGGTVSQVSNNLASGAYAIDSYGNFVEIKSVINGKTVYIKYNHLNKVGDNIRRGVKVGARAVLGLTGTTGNAQKNPNDPYAREVVPHVHIWAGEKPFDYPIYTKGINPAPYIATKFNSNGEVIQGIRPCDHND